MSSVQLTLIPLSELKPCIEVAFKHDDMLLKKFHIISKGTFEECVNHTFEVITKASKVLGIECYKLVAVASEGELIPIGYTILHKNSDNKNVLYSYGINIMYRYSIVRNSWLEWVGEQLGYPYTTILYVKNKRAIKFFQKHNFEIVDQADKSIVVLIKNI